MKETHVKLELCVRKTVYHLRDEEEHLHTVLILVWISKKNRSILIYIYVNDVQYTTDLALLHIWGKISDVVFFFFFSLWFLKKKTCEIVSGTVKDEGTYWLPYYMSGDKYGFRFNHTISPEDPHNQALINRWGSLKMEKF